MSALTQDDIRTKTQAVIEDVGVDADEVAFRSALWDAGLAMVQFPEGKGGLGVSPGLQTAVEETIRDSGRFFHPLAVNTIGIGMGLYAQDLAHNNLSELTCSRCRCIDFQTSHGQLFNQVLGINVRVYPFA